MGFFDWLSRRLFGDQKEKEEVILTIKSPDRWDKFKSDIPNPYGTVRTKSKIATSLHLPVELFIEYKDGHGEITHRKITANSISNQGSNPTIEAYCHERQADRTFRIGQIIKAARADTGEVVEFIGNLYPHAGTWDEEWWITAERLGIPKSTSNHEKVRAAVKYATCVYKAINFSEAAPPERQKAAIETILNSEDLLKYAIEWSDRIYRRRTINPRPTQNEYFQKVASIYK